MKHRYLEINGANPEQCLHTPLDLEDYLHCPMYWALKSVYSKAPDNIGMKEAWDWHLSDFLKNIMKEREEVFLFKDTIRDKWGEYMLDTHVFKHMSKQQQDKALSEGAQVLENLYEIYIKPEIAAADIPVLVYVNPGNTYDGSLKVNVSAVYENPFRCLYITHREIPTKRGDKLNNPLMFCLSSANARAQRAMGIPKKKILPAEIFSVSQNQTIQVPREPKSFKSGEHWTRTLECMDILGIYPRWGKHCKDCHFKNTCNISYSSVRNMKSSGPNKNIGRESIVKRNKSFFNKEETKPG